MSKAVAFALGFSTVIFGLVAGCGDRAIVGEPDPDPEKNLPAPVWPADAGAADGDKVDG